MRCTAVELQDCARVGGMLCRTRITSNYYQNMGSLVPHSDHIRNTPILLRQAPSVYDPLGCEEAQVCIFPETFAFYQGQMDTIQQRWTQYSAQQAKRKSGETEREELGGGGELRSIWNLKLCHSADGPDSLQHRSYNSHTHQAPVSDSWRSGVFPLVHTEQGPFRVQGRSSRPRQSRNAVR